MAAVRVSRQAQAEVDAIVAFHEGVGARAFAEVFERELVQRLRSLETFPRMGRKVPEIDDEAVREVLYRRYRVIYHVDADDELVEVLTVFHSAKPFGPTPGGSG